ncbi:putative CAP-Gly domain containing protein [Leishmania shawi]|uniref:CAP-Gly domain containing protein n=1 Tax=Leishmania shawi TaxID=5680 RepID=A0AAW3C141_9TRYP
MSQFGTERSSAQPVPPIDSFVEVLPVAPQVERRRGILRFYGVTDFAEGEWAGVELVGCEGRNNGAVKGISYFKCAPGQGLFVRPNLVVSYATEIPALTLAAAVTADSAKMEVLEEELRVARREAVEREKLKDSLEESLHSLQAELEQLRAAASQAAAKVDTNNTEDNAAATAMEDDDDDLVAQVELEEVRLELQRQLKICEAELKATKQSASEAAAACAAAEKRETEAENARKLSEAAQAALQSRNVELEMELARVQAELSSAAAQPSQSAQESSEVAAAASAACPDLQTALRVKDTELLQPYAAPGAACHTHERLREAKVQEQERVEAAYASEIARLQTDMAAMKTEKEELQELCQLLEEELKEQKAQSDALTHLVEELGAAKAEAEAAVERARQSATQEKLRLARELEEARVCEVRAMAAVALAGEGVVGHPSTSSTTSEANPSLEMALLQCRDELDEARTRILQLRSTQQVVQELQLRCDELTEAMRVQRAAAQKSDNVARATLAAAQQQHAQQVAQLRDACEAASLATQLNLAAAAQGANSGHSTVAAALSGTPLDAFREARYEARIRSLEQLLLECHAARMSSALWDVSAPHTRAWRGFEVPLASLKESVGRLLDFSTREACVTSTKALFQTPTALH